MENSDVRKTEAKAEQKSDEDVRKDGSPSPFFWGNPDMIIDDEDGDCC